MKFLYIISIVHAEKELGSFAVQIKKAYIEKSGLTAWKQHVTAIKLFWQATEQN